MAQLLLASLFLFLQILGVHSYDEHICKFVTGDTYYGLQYCEKGCCLDRDTSEVKWKCCGDPNVSRVFLIILGVVGGLCVLGAVVGFVICLKCTLKHKKGNAGRVIAPFPQQQRTTNVAVVSVSTHANCAHISAYRAQPEDIGHPMGDSQYGGTTGSFPQPPPYEQQPIPSATSLEYPPPRALYEPPSTSAQRLPPIDGASTQHFSARLPLIGAEADTPTA